jgi:hypothetical protein
MEWPLLASFNMFTGQLRDPRRYLTSFTRCHKQPGKRTRLTSDREGQFGATCGTFNAPSILSLWYIHCFHCGMKPMEVGPVVSPQKAAAPGALWGPDALDANRKVRRALQARYASRRDNWIRANRYYHDTIIRFLRFVIEQEKHVLKLRCLSGRLLNAVSPSRGVGVDITPEMIEIAQSNYPELLGRSRSVGRL